MSKKFCPRCGKPTEKFYNNLCADCFLEAVSVAKLLPEKLTTYLCKECGKYYVNKKHFRSLDSAVDNLLMNLLKQKELKSASYRISENKIIVALKIGIEDLEKTEEKEFTLIKKEIVCEFCSLKKSKYYRAILQIRAPKNTEQEILQDVESQIKKVNEFDNFAFVSSVEKLEAGTNFYIGSKSAAHKVANFLKQKYHAKTKISRKLFGEESGKKVYRDTILVSIK